MISDPLTARAQDRLSKIWRQHRSCGPLCDQRWLMENYGLLRTVPEPAVLVTADGGIRVMEHEA
jgi:hypothetical protein